MFGAGWTEMLIIGIVALVVIGPKDLPVVMRKLGRVVGTVRRMGGEFQRELNKTTGLDQITDLRRSITEPLRQTSDEIAREFNRQTSTGFEPTGIIKPSDPAVESVYDQLAATADAPATTTVAAGEPVMPASAAPEPSPAPPEATEPVPTAERKATRKAPRAVAAAEPATPAVKPARPRAPAGKQKALAALAPQSETATPRRKPGPKPASAKAAAGSAAAKAATPRARGKKT